jgi:hypothetical protein
MYCFPIFYQSLEDLSKVAIFESVSNATPKLQHNL